MATSKERRKIAERLRIEAKTVRRDGNGLWTRLEIAVNGWNLGKHIDDSYALDNKVFTSLADLIDPTCKVSSVEPVEDEVGLTVGWEFHLTCGHTVEMQWNEAPVYCPECGARVVDGGEG